MGLLGSELLRVRELFRITQFPPQLQADDQNCNEKQVDINTSSVLTKGLKRHAG